MLIIEKRVQWFINELFFELRYRKSLVDRNKEKNDYPLFLNRINNSYHKIKTEIN